MINKTLLAVTAAALTLSSCTKTDGEGDSFKMSIDMNDDSDDVKKSGDKEAGKFSIKAEGFALDVDLPSFTLDSDDFDLNNVALYPGTKVTALNVEDTDGEGGKVTVSFVSPTGSDKLIDWFEEKMTAEDFVVAKSGNTLSGKTDEGDPFHLELTEDSKSKTSGKLTFLEAD